MVNVSTKKRVTQAEQLAQVLVRQVLRLYQADTATPEHHLIQIAQVVAQQPVIQVCKRYIHHALMPVIVLLRVTTATIRHQKFIPVHLMVHAARKQHVTQAEHLAQILVRQVIHTHP